MEAKGLVTTTLDFDGKGMLYYLTPPVTTGLELLFKRGLTLPQENMEVYSHFPSKEPWHFLLSLLSSAFHEVRPVNKNTITGIKLLRGIALFENWNIENYGLTAREEDLWHATEGRLYADGLMDIFNDVFLNKGFNSSKGLVAPSCKENHMRMLIESVLSRNGSTPKKIKHFHFDDDYKIGRVVERLHRHFSGRVDMHAYIFRNLSNRQLLLNWARQRESENITIVNSFPEALIDIWGKLSKSD